MFSPPRGGLGVFTDKDERSILFGGGEGGGVEFQKSVFWGILVIAGVSFEGVKKCCIFKCFMFSTVLSPVKVLTR